MRDFGLNGRNGLERSGIVKSIQRGTISLGTALTGTATLSPAVNLNNAYVSYSGGYSTDTQSLWSYPACDLFLTNSTTVTATRTISGSTATSATWEVIEYFPGVIRSIQRGRTVVNNAPATTTINAVDITKSLLIFAGFSSGGNNPSRNDYSNMQAQLTNATTVTFTCGYATPDNICSWQVVEYF